MAKSPVAVGLNGIAEYSAQPFIDVMKASRAWHGHQNGWGDFFPDRLRAGGHLDADGWPISIPAGVRAVFAVILVEANPLDTGLRGRFRLMWDGQGTINVHGNVSNVTRNDSARHLEFDHTPNGSGLVEVSITATDRANPIKNIRCVKVSNLAAYQAGAIFRPEWLEIIRG